MATAPQLNVRLFTRAEDAGSSRSANRAIRTTVEQGCIRNVSLMAPGHEIADAATVLAGLRGCAFGLHLTLNCEWSNVRWQPLLPRAQVPTLVDTDGGFPAGPWLMKDRPIDAGQVVAEAAAQLQKLRALGFPIAYVDEHMGVAAALGLQDAVADFCRREGLFYLSRAAHEFPLPSATDAPAREGLVTYLSKRVDANGRRDFAGFCHPTYDDDEMRACGFAWTPTVNDEGVKRFADTRAARDPGFLPWCAEAGITVLAVGEG